MHNNFAFGVGLEEAVAVQDKPTPISIDGITRPTSIGIYDNLIASLCLLPEKFSVEEQAGKKRCKKIHNLQNDETYEKAVISPPNACVQPGAVVIESFDAQVTNVAVPASGQDYDLAFRTHLS